MKKKFCPICLIFIYPQPPSNVVPITPPFEAPANPMEAYVPLAGTAVGKPVTGEIKTTIVPASGDALARVSQIPTVGDFLPRDGSLPMTGELILSGDATDPLGAVTLQQLAAGAVVMEATDESDQTINDESSCTFADDPVNARMYHIRNSEDGDTKIFSGTIDGTIDEDTIGVVTFSLTSPFSPVDESTSCLASVSFVGDDDVTCYVERDPVLDRFNFSFLANIGEAVPFKIQFQIIVTIPE